MIKVREEIDDLLVHNGEDFDEVTLNRTVIKIADLLDNSSITDKAEYIGYIPDETELNNVSINDIVYKDKNNEWQKANINNKNESIGILLDISGSKTIIFAGLIDFPNINPGEEYYISTTEPGKLQTISYDGAINIGTGVGFNKLYIKDSMSDTINGYKSSDLVKSNEDNEINANIGLNKSLFYINNRTLLMPKLNSNILRTKIPDTGYIKIKLPILWNSTSIRFDVNIHNNNSSTRITIGGLLDNTDTKWVNVYATEVHSDNIFNEIHFGYDDTSACIFIGSSIYDYINVSLENFIGSSDNDLMPLLNSWDISIVYNTTNIVKSIKTELISSMSNDTKLFMGEPIENFIRNNNNDVNITIGTTSIGDESDTQKESSLHSGQSFLNSSWIYTNAIQSSDRSSETGIAIGNDGFYNDNNNEISLYNNNSLSIKVNEDVIKSYLTIETPSIILSEENSIISLNGRTLSLYDNINEQNILKYDNETNICNILDKTGIIEIGSIEKDSDTIITLKTSSGYKNKLEMVTEGQGSSEIFIGQSESYGSGWLYNGDDTPYDLGVSDDTVFYNNRNSEKTIMFKWNVVDDFVTFETTPKVKVDVGSYIEVALADHTHEATELTTLGGLTSEQFLRSDEEDTMEAILSIGNNARGTYVASDEPSIQSVNQSNSDFNNEPFLNTGWLYTTHIEAANERTEYSTGIAIGKDGLKNLDNHNITLYSGGINAYTIKPDASNEFLTNVTINGSLNLKNPLNTSSDINMDNTFLFTNNGGSSYLGIYDRYNDYEVLRYSESDKILRLIANDGSIRLGSLIKEKDNNISIQTASTYRNYMELITAGQGNSELYIGTDVTSGFGFLYNGNSDTEPLKDENWNIFYNKYQGNKTSMFGWHSTHDFVTFDKTPEVDGVPVALADHTHEYDSGLDAETLQGLTPDYFLPANGTAANSLALGGIVSSEYALLTSTVSNSLSLGGIESSLYLLSEDAKDTYVSKSIAYDTIGIANGIGATGFLKYSSNIYSLDADGNPELDETGTPIVTDIDKQRITTKVMIDDKTDLTMSNVREPILHLKHKTPTLQTYGILLEMDGEGKIDSEVDKAIVLKTSDNSDIYPDYAPDTDYVIGDVVNDPNKDFENLYQAISGGTSIGETIDVDDGVEWELYEGDIKYIVYGDGTLEAEGDIYFKGSAEFGGLLRVHDGATIDGNTDIVGNTSISGSLDVSSSIKTGLDLDVTNDLTVNNNTTLNSNTNINGPLSISDITNTSADVNIGGNLSVDGDITASGDINSNSDERIKEDITIIEDAINKVKEIKGVTYTRNDLEDTERRYTGVIAQDVEKVLPEAVNEEDGLLSVAYGNMVGLLIQAIKEQQEQITLLEDRITKLEDNE